MTGGHNVKEQIQQSNWVSQGSDSRNPEPDVGFGGGSEMLVTGKLHKVRTWKYVNDSVVSAANDIRDELRYLVRGYLGDGVHFAELDYQPR